MLSAAHDILSQDFQNVSGLSLHAVHLEFCISLMIT